MASLDVFESTLKEVVQARRLSARKMTELTEIALKLMEHDTQLVSVLYRTHKNLPPASKVSSLYVFDALSRAARHQVTKQGLTGSLYSEKGNCATFLLKVEGVLEGLFQDMLTVGSDESKGKSQKILDIWVKGNTFPSTILSRLTKLFNEPEKVLEVEPVSGSTAISLPTIAASTPPVLDTQAALLALLTQAANATIANPSEQTSTNTTVSAPGGPAQLVLLQQLAQKAISTPLADISAPSVVPPRPSTESPIPPFSPTGDRPQSPVPQRDFQHDNYRLPIHAEKYRSRSPELHKPPETHNDHRRGSFRGNFRGRGRGDSRGKRDDHDRFRDRDRRRNGRSRSRSPSSRYPSRRDMRTYSPPRRPTLPSSNPQRQVDNPDSSNSDGKDEFGRDIRPQPPENLAASPDKPTTSITVNDPPVVSSPASNIEQISMSPLVAANTSSSNSSAPFVSSTVPSQAGLESFDPTGFDPTSPPSWEQLGKLWQVTYGEMPTTEQLMQFVMQSMAGGQVPAIAHTGSEVQGSSWGNSYGHGQQWKGHGHGGHARSGLNGYGNDRNGWNHYDDGQTDAVVLGSSPDTAERKLENNAIPQENSRGTGGKMQKVGDKWVFVRDP